MKALVAVAVEAIIQGTYFNLSSNSSNYLY